MSQAVASCRRLSPGVHAFASERSARRALPLGSACDLPFWANALGIGGIMIRKVALIATALATVGACARTKVQSAGGELATAVPPNARTLSAGTMIEVKTNEKLSNDNKVGDKFTATVSDNVDARNGQTVVPEGSATSPAYRMRRRPVRPRSFASTSTVSRSGGVATRSTQR